MDKTSQRHRLIIRALMAVFLIAGVVGAAMAGSAEEQLKQDAYEKIMDLALGSVIKLGMGEGKQHIGKRNRDVYTKHRETKVLVSCIYWHGNSVKDLKIGPGWSSFNPSGGRFNSGDLRRNALNICKSRAKGKGHDCKCQIVDANDKNKLKLPKDWKERVLASQEGNLRSANLEGTNFRNVNLQGFNFEGANLRKANLSSARLQKANFDGASLVNAYLQLANLQGASFRNANFQKAMLNGAVFLGAKFQGADLSGARGLTQEQLDKACGDENTKLPKNLTIKRCPSTLPPLASAKGPKVEPEQEAVERPQPSVAEAAPADRFDGVWAGKVSVCQASEDVEIQVEDGRFAYQGPKIGTLSDFQGQIDETTGKITGYMTWEMRSQPSASRALKGRVWGNKLSAKGPTDKCDVVIILTREGTLPGRVASTQGRHITQPKPAGAAAGMRTDQDTTAPMIEVAGATQALRQAAYEKIMGTIREKWVSAYRNIKHSKVMSVCIGWSGNNVEDLEVFNSGTTSSRGAMMGQMRRARLNNCRSSAKGKGYNCKCQIVDENDKNKLKLSKNWKERVLDSERGNLRTAPARGDLGAGQDAFGKGNYATAFKAWLPLAEQGDVIAQSNLGFLFLQGRGVPRDYDEALKWSRKAADHGDATALNNLGIMYADGLGVPQDDVQALTWFNLAVAQVPKYRDGLAEQFRNNRDKLAAEMTTTNVSEAQKLAREWLEKREQ